MICCGSPAPLSPAAFSRAQHVATVVRAVNMAAPAQYRLKAHAHSSAAGQQTTTPLELKHGQELDANFSGLDAGTGVMTVAGFGSLLSERSARTTFPDLQNFRPGRLYGFRRVFAHTADIFFQRGIARPETREIGSLSCEPASTSSSSSVSGSESESGEQQQQHQQQQPTRSSSGSNLTCSSSDGEPSSSGTSPSLVVSLFEVPYTPANVAAFIEREHEFRFLAVQPHDLAGEVVAGRLAVLCGANTDAHYKATRCPPDEWQRRWGVHGISSVWSNDVLPCRVYLRHCVLAAQGFCEEAYHSFLDDTYLSDRATTIRQYLQQHPDIMQELPPPELVGRYSG